MWKRWLPLSAAAVSNKFHGSLPSNAKVTEGPADVPKWNPQFLGPPIPLSDFQLTIVNRTFAPVDIT